MLPPQAIRGAFRTDYRARAAYAEAAGIYRILPAAVCAPTDIDDLRVARSLGGGARDPPGPARRRQRHGRRQRRRRRRRGPHAAPDSSFDSAGAPRRGHDANVTLAELNGAADRHGLRLPPDPSSGRWATLGGMLSTNAAGRALGPLRQRAPVGALGASWSPPTGGGASSAAASRRRPRRRRDPTGSRRRPRPRIARAAELVSRRFPRTRKNSSGYGTRRLARDRRPARPRDRRRRHARHRDRDRVAARPRPDRTAPASASGSALSTRS